MPTINRWRVLPGSVLILLCTGSIYAFSVFSGPLSAAHGWTVPEVMNAFIINGAIAPVPMILGGFIIDRGGARWSITIGAILFALGFILTGVATNTTQLYLFSGLMIASQLSPIAQTSMFAISAATAALLVSVYSICNTLGRFAWGALSDRIGYTKSIAFIYGVVALSLVVLLMAHSTFGFVVGIVGLGLCFGGVMGVFPALTMKTYGPRFQGMNYGIMFTGYSVSAYFGPKIGATLGGGAKGDYTTPFVIAIVVALVGLVLTLVLSRLGGTKSTATPTPQPVGAAS